jgi:hypothetical protein
MVCSKAREHRGEAEYPRALYYNRFNAIHPGFALEDANALVATPSERAASRSTEAQVGGS